MKLFRKGLLFIALLLFTPFMLKSQGSGNMLNFDSKHDVVRLPILSSNISNSDFTIETWVNIRSFSHYGGIVTAMHSSTGGWGILTDKTGLVSPYPLIKFIYGTSSEVGHYNKVTSNELKTDTWYHVAAVRTGDSIKLYINGILQGTEFSDYNINNNQIFVGKRYINHNMFHNGKVDELRIWNTALNQDELREWMCKKVNNIHPQYSKLVAYYRFDDKNENIANDLSGNENNGTMSPSVEKITSAAPIGDESTYLYTHSPSLSISHPDGDKLSISNFENDVEGAHIYMVNEAPNTLTGTEGVGSNDRYFGVFKVSESENSYNAIYEFDGNPGVSEYNYQDLKVFKRDNNADMTWEETGSYLNTASNSFSMVETHTEFILGSSDVPLPIELLSFDAKQDNKKVKILWKTLTEINNDYFVVEKSFDGENWSEVEKINGQGNSNSILSYAIYDNNISSGTIYYRLKQVDFNGQYSYSDIKVVNISNTMEQELNVYPNPAIEKVTVNGVVNDVVKIYNIMGQDVSNITSTVYKNNNEHQIDISSLKSGVYFIKSGEKTFKVQKQ